jgi:surface protein
MYQFTDQPTKRSTLSKSWLIGIGLTVLLVVIIVIVVLWQEGHFKGDTSALVYHKFKNKDELISAVDDWLKASTQELKDVVIEKYGHISNWNVGNIDDMQDLFSKQRNSYELDPSNFNDNINGWDVSNVTNMSSMFRGATSFNQPLDLWDTSKVTDMTSMFAGVTAFNQPLDWDTSKVTYMTHMFNGATAFNQPLDWDTSQVESMAYMFSNAINFDQILKWNVGKVKIMLYMFNNATSFYANGENWKLGVGKWKPEALTTEMTTKMFSNENSNGASEIYTVANANTSTCISYDGKILIIGENNASGFFFN